MISPGKGLVIRPFCEEDFPAVLKLYRLLYGSMAELSPRYMLAGAQDEEFLRAVLQSDEDDILVAEAAGEIKGFAMVQTGITPPYPCIVEHRFGCLMELMVKEEERGRGIGSALIRESERWCQSRGLRYLEVDVLEKNEGAMRLYRRFGFTGEVITMRRWLDETETASE